MVLASLVATGCAVEPSTDTNPVADQVLAEDVPGADAAVGSTRAPEPTQPDESADRGPSEADRPGEPADPTDSATPNQPDEAGQRTGSTGTGEAGGPGLVEMLIGAAERVATTEAVEVLEPTIELNECGPALECGTVTVPADYRDPELDTLEIAVNVWRSADPDTRIGYLFVNPGGPGGSGVEMVADMAATAGTGYWPAELTSAFDIVGFDPRGVAASEPEFACGEGDEQFRLLSQITDVAADREIGDRAASLCIESMGRVGALLHSEYVARDIDEIRTALGERRISYLGYSYGSTLGGWYATLFPERVRAMVLDGAPNPLFAPDTSLDIAARMRGTYASMHGEIEAALAECRDASCPIFRGGPEATWRRAAAKMHLVADARGGNADAVALAIVGHFYDASGPTRFHQSVYRLAEHDDPSGFLAAIERGGTVDGSSFTSHVNCLDMWALFPSERLALALERADDIGDEVEEFLRREFPLVGDIAVTPPWSSCLFYEAIRPPMYTGTFDGGAVPILVVGNHADPITPHVESWELAEGVLLNGRLVSVTHHRHTVYPDDECVNAHVHAALLELIYPDDSADC